MRLTYGRLMVGAFALWAGIPACGGGSKCCTPVTPVSTKDADSGRDAPLDHGVDGRQTDASAPDAKDGPGGLPCLEASWDGSSNNPDVCRNEVGSASVLVTGTCGDYRVMENATDGDDEVFYDRESVHLATFDGPLMKAFPRVARRPRTFVSSR